MRWIRQRLLRALGFAFALSPLVAGAQASAPSSTPAPAQAPPTPVQTAPGQAAPSAAVPVHASPRFAVVIDAAHGGTDTGARLSDHLLEKDLVLNLSVRLRSTLSAHGIYVVTTRESDSTIPAQGRAEAANHVGAAACITLHATSSGNGVHLFTSSLTQIPMTRFLPWDTAQGAYADQSLRLSAELNSAMIHAEIPVTLGKTALQPLDSFTCPAVTVEVAPLHETGRMLQLSDQEYQDRLVAALAAAVEQWQRDWRLP
jgi:N-acetylmuramoyl-L-alanine amidase